MGANCLYQDEVVKVDHSRYGRGLFTKVKLEADFAIGPYSGQRLTDEEASLEQRLGNVYLFEVMKNIIIDARDKRFATAARYANCADSETDQNCEFKVLERGDVWLVTLKAVKAGGELLPYYDMTDASLCTVIPVDPKWLRNRIWMDDSYNALIAAEKHRRNLEEQLSDMEDHLALEQQAVISCSYQQTIKTIQNNKTDEKESSEDTGDDNYEPTVKKTKANEYDTLEMMKTEKIDKGVKHKSCIRQLSNPRFGIKETDRGWTGYHEFVGYSFKSKAQKFNDETKASLKARAEHYRDTGKITKTVLSMNDTSNNAKDQQVESRSLEMSTSLPIPIPSSKATMKSDSNFLMEAMLSPLSHQNHD